MEATTDTPHDLTKLVIDRITALGKDAPAYFGVPAGLISQWKSGKKPVSLAAAEKVYAEMLADVAKAVMPQIVAEPEPVNGDGRVHLLMPMMDGLAPETFTTLLRACKLYGMERISVIPKWRTLVIEARNDLAQKFLATGAEWAIFVDSDGVFPCGSGGLLRKIGLSLPEPKASRNFIERLMSHPADKLIVGALYKDRRGGTRAQCELGFKSPQENERLLKMFDPAVKSTDGLEPCGWVGFSAVRVHRSVFLKMIEAAKPGGPLADIAPPAGRENDAYGFFDTTRQARGEDVKFCRRAAQVGVSVFLDTGCILGHIGSKIY
jgi:hypothetical protein